ncbi:hypothetical protein EJF18_70267 [Clavispora lusitaniae]|uniref:Uncharacterized protein n=1 Tax=Clavispora lusitaniae TaxID=36911 RepID=A0ACD0WS43_CLALS|nr:hypothetical protein EJF14_70267 [Clavispora lusitaniae]QFZ35853.1 hypothetical protein EJF16_70267 [Clavispora lusitaniae]QFZ41535.1 hypothetical protein EJF15_70267 [Clavispora lusitaniae]QFZ47213.1 hypothetical protein EJF18_70267 [Clavispora lusitaniae]QFZ52890.1 hypothetical protein EJF17_70267 [Clavispora lusitaniae]
MSAQNESLVVLSTRANWAIHGPYFLSHRPTGLVSHLQSTCIRRLLGQNKVLELLVGLVQVVVDNDQIVGASSSVLHLSSGSGDSLGNGILSLGASSSQSLLQSLDRRRRHKQVSGVNGRSLDRLDTLHINVQETDLVGLDHVFNGLDGRAVVVTRESGPLDELLLVNHLLEILHLGEVVVHTINFAGSRRSSGVGNRKAKLVGELSKELFQKSGLTSARRPGNNNWSSHGKN